MSEERVVTVHVAGGGTVTMEGVDPVVEAAVREVARHGIYAHTVFATQEMRPLFDRLSHLGYYMHKLLRARFNYHLEIDDFRPFHELMESIHEQADDLHRRYKAKVKTNMDIIHGRSDNE